MELPRFVTVSVSCESARATRARLGKLDSLLVVLPRAPTAAHFRGLPQGRQLAGLLARAKRRKAAVCSAHATNERATAITLAATAVVEPFKLLRLARRLVAETLKERPATVGVLIRGFDDGQRQAIAEAVTAAAQAAAFELPRFKSKAARRRRLRSLVFLETASEHDLTATQAAAYGNNIARWFTALPPNKLTVSAYRAGIERLAAELGIESRFLGEKALRELGAGAFLAVTQGNVDRDAGIVHLRYTPPQTTGAKLALVGKGVLFDTGGVNLKPFKGMLDMHTDMQGSAVVLGTLAALAKLGAPLHVDAWLAVTPNLISATAYRSQDVVEAANGTTIQVINTDAEGRMVLADTLAIAAREKPDLIIDFATLTGSCISALTTRYSGVFTNRYEAHESLIRAGQESGERVWPFPMDDDYEEMLSSEVADVKQCAEDSAGDHIVAARFLARFVPATIPWVHVDMSAGQHKGGLAHVPTEITGFGVRFALELLRPSIQHGASLADALGREPSQ